jgi:hypothetical protein
MSDLSATGEAIVLAALLDARFISLHSADPGVTGANELSGSSYARSGSVLFAQSGSNPTVASNVDHVEFPQATGDWLTPTYFGVWTDGVGGDFLGRGSITDPRDVLNGDVARFLSGELEVEAD